MVMQQPVTISAEQLDVFVRLYPMNARPVQQAAGRLIKQSN
jgi:carbonic anhydrase